MSVSTINFILDIILVLASIWMLMAIRGVGGVMGRTLGFIVVGAIILGAAHILATLMAPLVNDTAVNQMIHRIIVLIGFVFLAVGFRQLQSIK